ncbi:MAG: OmpA family protein [Bryobacterales bacterium]|nr:OmpA family protein [Bryobacterales bacterium]
MAIQQEPEQKSGGAPAWMCTFADLMSLLLTFFVLLLSMSSTEAAKFRAMAGSLRDAFGMRSDLALSPTSMSDEILPNDDARQGDPQPEPEADEFEQELRESLEAAGLDMENVTLEGDKDTVVLRLDSDVLFASGDAALKPEAYPAIDAIAAYLSTTNYTLDVVGHTDSVPIATSLYPSNWELSAARAGQAVRRLTEQHVDPARLRAIGRADTGPVAENNTEQGRRENRRVEFIFTRPPDPESMSLPKTVEPESPPADSSLE